MNKVVSLVLGLFLGFQVGAQAGHDHPNQGGHLVFKQNTLHIHASFATEPNSTEEALLVLEAHDAKTHQIIDINDNIEVELWMPSMGHGSAPTQIERAIDAKGSIIPGVFNVRNVYFIMSGEWEVQVKLTNSSGASEMKSFKVNIVGSGHGGH